MAETIKTDETELLQLLGYFRKHLRLTTSDADADLRAKLLSALTSVGRDVNRILVGSTVTVTAMADSFGGQIKMTLRGPVREVQSVSVDGVALVEGEGYFVQGNRLRIIGDFRDAFIEVIYKAGIEQLADTVPDMWEAVCLRGAGSYANPLDSIQERLRASDILIRSYRYTDWQS
jgi:hypothetical protein